MDYVVTSTAGVEELRGYGIIIGSPDYSTSRTVVTVFDLNTEAYETFNQAYITKTYGTASLSDIILRRMQCPLSLQGSIIYREPCPMVRESPHN